MYPLPRLKTVKQNLTTAPTTRCPACGVELGSDWDAEMMARDREYFEQHPEARRYRRLPFRGEHPFSTECSGRLMIVEVTAVAAGVRTRVGYELAGLTSGGVQ